MQAEIDARDNHEEDGDRLHRGTGEVAKARVVGRKAADGHGGEGMANGVEWRHSREPVRQSASQRDAEVNQPQRLCGFGDAWPELRILDRSRRLGAVKLHAAHSQHRQHGNRQHDDAHAPQPLQELPIEQNGARQFVEPGDDGRPRGREPGERLEGGVGK